MTKIPYSIRIDQELLLVLKERAKKEMRPVNNLIEFILSDYLTKASQKK